MVNGLVRWFGGVRFADLLNCYRDIYSFGSAVVFVAPLLYLGAQSCDYDFACHEYCYSVGTRIRYHVHQAV